MVSEGVIIDSKVMSIFNLGIFRFESEGIESLGTIFQSQLLEVAVMC